MSKYEIATAKQKAQRRDAKLLIRSAKSTPTPFSASMSLAFHQGQLYSSNINFNDFFFFLEHLPSSGSWASFGEQKYNLKS